MTPSYKATVSFKSKCILGWPKTFVGYCIYTHVIQNNLRTAQLAGFARQLGCKKTYISRISMVLSLFKSLFKHTLDSNSNSIYILQ